LDRSIRSLSDIFTQIESHRFIAELDAVSGYGVFKVALTGHERVQALQQSVTQLPEAAELLYDRLIGLLDQTENPNLAHPYDAAIATYLSVLKSESAERTQQAIAHIQQTPGLFWARKFAAEFQQQMTL
jgi:hypothetical protein